MTLTTFFTVSCNLSERNILGWRIGDTCLNVVLLSHVAPAGRVEEGVEPHGDDVPEDLGLDELAVQEAIEALPEKVPLPVCRFIFPLSP